MKAANAYSTWLKGEVQGTVETLARGEMALINEAKIKKKLGDEAGCPGGAEA